MNKIPNLMKLIIEHKRSKKYCSEFKTNFIENKLLIREIERTEEYALLQTYIRWVREGKLYEICISMY